MELAPQRREEHGWTVLGLSGELDLSNAEALSEAIEEAMDGAAPQLAVDLSAVTFMDSSALGVLVKALHAAHDRDGEVALVGVNGPPAKVLAITGLDQVFRSAASMDALAAEA